MRVTEYLRNQVAEDWMLATRHPFTAALAGGTLEPDLMRGYLQQDYLFIDQFVRLLATTIAHAPSLADSVPAAQFLGVITGPENTYFLRSFEALGIQADAEPAPETVNFQNLMEEARLSGRYEIMLSVLVVAEWVYLEWATPFADRVDDLPFWLGEWITLHTGEGFAGVVEYLRSQLDKAWVGLEEHEKALVQEYFTEAVKREKAFFEGAWAGFPIASGKGAS